MEARRKGQSVAQYENDDIEMPVNLAASRPSALKSKPGFGSRFLKLVGAGKSASDQAKRGHHEFGKVGHILRA